MFKFHFKSPEKKEDVSNLNITVEVDDAGVALIDKKSLFDGAVRKVVKKELETEVRKELRRMLLGEKRYKLFVEADEYLDSVEFLEKNRKMSLDERTDLLVEKFPGVPIVGWAGACPYVDHSLEINDLVSHIAGEILEKMEEEGKLA